MSKKQVEIFFKKNYVQLSLVFLLIILLRFYPFIFQQKTLVFGDNYSLMVPGKVFTAQWLKQGILPLWNPTIFAGIPWLADVNQSVFYPSTLLFMVFYPATALNLTIILQMLVAMLGMYLLAKKWTKNHYVALVAGVLWTLSTQLADGTNNLSIIQSLPWLPWVSYFGLQLFAKRWAKVWFAVVVWLQFAGGYPQHVLYAILAAVGLELMQDWGKIEKKKWLLTWFETAVLTVGLSSVIWLPFIQALLNSTRMQQSLHQATAGSMHPLMLIKLLVPYFFDKPLAGYKWGPAWSGHPNMVFFVSWFGLLVLGLSFNKRQQRDKLFLGLILGSLIFSLGGFLPGFFLIQKIIPLMQVGRYPSMILIVTNMLVSLWVAEKLKDFKIKQKIFKKINLGLLLIFLLASFAWLVSRCCFAEIWQLGDSLIAHKLSMSAFHTLARDQIIAENIFLNLLVSAGLCLFTVNVWQKKKKYLALLGIILSMIYATQEIFFFAPQQVYDLPEPIFAEYQNQQYRWLTRNANVPYTNYDSYWEALVVRKPFSDSFVNEQELQDFAHLSRLQKSATPNWNMASAAVDQQLNLIHGYTCLLPQNFAQQWANSAEARINFIGQIDLADEQDLALLRHWAVKYYLVDNWFEVKENFADLGMKLVATDGDYQLYEISDTLSRFRYEDGTAVELLNFSETPNEINLEFNNEQGHEYLIMADRYDPGWRAWVNGEEVEVEEWEGMRRVRIGEKNCKLRLFFNY